MTVGRPSLAGDLGPLAERVTAWDAAGYSTVAVVRDGSVAGLIALTDPVKPSAAPAIAELVAAGLRPVLLTGDGEAAARSVASAVGIEQVVAGAMPDEKVDVVRQLQSEGATVAMVGDGVNDAAALATADLGIAVGSGTDVALEAADVVLVRDDLRVLPSTVELARETLRTVRGNLWWAFGYNVVAVPVAAAGLLNPLLAGAAMAVSSLLVVTNSLRLRRAVPGAPGAADPLDA